MVDKAESSAERAPSVSSSVTAADGYNEKNNSRDSSDGSYVLKTPEELDDVDEIEREALLMGDEEDAKTVSTPPPPPTSTTTAIIWMVVNTLATIGIVSRIFFPRRQHAAPDYL